MNRDQRTETKEKKSRTIERRFFSSNFPNHSVDNVPVTWVDRTQIRRYADTQMDNKKVTRKRKLDETQSVKTSTRSQTQCNKKSKAEELDVCDDWEELERAQEEEWDTLCGTIEEKVIESQGDRRAKDWKAAAICPVCGAEGSIIFKGNWSPYSCSANKEHCWWACGTLISVQDGVRNCSKKKSLGRELMNKISLEQMRQRVLFIRKQASALEQLVKKVDNTMKLRQL